MFFKKEVKFKGICPIRQTEGSAGYDLISTKSIVLQPNERVTLPTGTFIQLPKGYEAQVRPRSGLAHKYGVTVLNAPGTIDSDYTNEIGVILINLGDEAYSVNKGDRIAQLVIAKYETLSFVEKPFNLTNRNGGFGSTGKS